MGGRPRQEEKLRRGHRHTGSPSSPRKPCPQAMRGDNPPRGRHQGAAVAGASAVGSVSLRGPRRARSTPYPGSHPRITHGALIHHEHAAPHAQHPRAGASRHPPSPATSSRAPAERLQGISKFPGAELAALCSLSPAEHPCASRCCNRCLTTLQHAVRAGSCRPRLCKRGSATPKMGQPHPGPPRKDSPVLTHTPLPGEEDKGRWHGTDVTQGARGAL